MTIRERIHRNRLRKLALFWTAVAFFCVPLLLDQWKLASPALEAAFGICGMLLFLLHLGLTFTSKGERCSCGQSLAFAVGFPPWRTPRQIRFCPSCALAIDSPSEEPSASEVPPSASIPHAPGPPSAPLR